MTFISMLLLQGEWILLTFSINITPRLLSSCHEMSLLLSILLKEHISLLIHAKIWKCLCLESYDKVHDIVSVLNCDQICFHLKVFYVWCKLLVRRDSG